jgi:hypothetical protein
MATRPYYWIITSSIPADNSWSSYTKTTLEGSFVALIFMEPYLAGVPQLVSFWSLKDIFLLEQNPIRTIYTELFSSNFIY